MNVAAAGGEWSGIDAPHVLREYACWRRRARDRRRATRRLRLDVLSPLGLARRVLVADRRLGHLRSHPARTIRVGRLLRAAEPDLAQPLGHPQCDDRVPRSARAARPTPSARWSCGASRASRRPLAGRGSSSPVGDYGERRPRDLDKLDDGAWTGRLADAQVCWAGGEAAALSPTAMAAGAVLTLTSRRGAPRLRARARRRRRRSANPDRNGRASRRRGGARARARGTVAPRDAPHAYAVLAGLTSAGGGMVAAATMSPSRAGREGRNYDYRYVWIRDQCFAGAGRGQAGPHPLMDDAVRFVPGGCSRTAPLKPAYTIAGGASPTSASSACRLSGRLRHRRQLGQQAVPARRLRRVAAAVRRAARHDHLDADGWRAAETAVAAIEQRWREPDAGIWEIDTRRWTHSRLICAAGLRAHRGPAPASEQAARWVALADAIVADTAATRCTRPALAALTRTTRVDAALLMPAVRGASPRDDPRTARDAARSRAELTQDGYCYRFRPDERPLGEAEGAFLLCGFLMALPAPAGRARRAPRAGSSATAPRAARRACRRSSTSASVSCAATCPRPLSTRCCSSAPCTRPSRPRQASTSSARGPARRIGSLATAQARLPAPALRRQLARGFAPTPIRGRERRPGTAAEGVRMRARRPSPP